MTAGFNIRMPDFPSDRTYVPTFTTTGTAPDLSCLAALWNSGPVGRAIALEIASLSTQKETRKP